MYFMYHRICICKGKRNETECSNQGDGSFFFFFGQRTGSSSAGITFLWCSSSQSGLLCPGSAPRISAMSLVVILEFNLVFDLTDQYLRQEHANQLWRRKQKHSSQQLAKSDCNFVHNMYVYQYVQYAPHNILPVVWPVPTQYLQWGTSCCESS